MKIAIIGAGPSGLISLKYAIDDGHNCDVFEQTGSVGGTFAYTNCTDFDENDLPVHSAMYRDLITNLPKEIMSFSDFHYPEQEISFIGQTEVLSYYQNYVDHFNLRQHIQLYKCVINVELTEENKWIVKVRDAKAKSDVSSTYDAVIVCNGHYSSPIIPEIPGQDVFQGLQLHSHKYRFPDPYQDKSVLIIGTGPSGQDIALQTSDLAKHVYLAVSSKLYVDKRNNMTEKPKVVKLLQNTAIFEDGTQEMVDVILYCTGYKYSVPFLEKNCGVEVTEKKIFPLFKHVVNINNPTMFFIGLSFYSVLPMLDIQARFAVAAIGKMFHLPSKEDMMKELENEMLYRQENGISEKFAHKLGDGETQRKYYQSLCDLSGISNIPLVVTKIFDFVIESKLNRRISYKIVDNENFEFHEIK